MDRGRVPTTSELTGALDEMRALAEAASAAALELVAACDERRLFREDGATSMTAWLAARYRLTRRTAREWVRVAHALRGLPEIRRAYARGALSWDQLRPLTSFATPETDARLAREAPGRSAASLRREAERHRRVGREETERAHRARYLDLFRDEEQFLHLNGMLPPEQGAVVEAALSRRAEEVPLEEGPLADPWGARMADALVELVTEGGGKPAPTTLVVHADAGLLPGAPGGTEPPLAETESGVRLAPEALRRLACDASVGWLLEQGGRPVGVGRRGRTVPPWLGRLLRHRDRGCRFPGCERVRRAKAHHLWHWADGGPTDLDNLLLLCQAHHRLVHEGGWRVRGHPAGEIRFHRPDGRPFGGPRLPSGRRSGPLLEVGWDTPPTTTAGAGRSTDPRGHRTA